MSCECSKYVNCGDATIELATYDDSSEFSHSVSQTVLSDDVLVFLQKTTRSFFVSYAWDRSIKPGYVLSGCGNVPRVVCDNVQEAIPSSSCREYCSRECNIPYYWDRQRDIYVWKSIKEELDFSVASNKTAAFRMKWGTGQFHKICIPNTVRTLGAERFLMVKNGVQSVLAEVEYTYNPFPLTESGGATWGLYGSTISRSATPDTADIACILLFPTVPKQAIALDSDVIAYGFYDYNAVEGGFTESSLPKDDGGKDYFYPYWCRSMPTDPLWRQVADTRYEVIYSGGSLGPGLNLEGVTAWTPSKPLINPWPFGSFALDSKENFIASCVAQFGERVGKGIVYNESNVGNLFEALTKAGVSTRGPYTALYPVTPL